MRLYSRDGAASVSHGGVTYTPGEDGGFDFPEDVGRQLHAFHVHGRPLWETSIGLQNRLMSEELERRKDPVTLLDAVNQLVAAAQAATPAAPAAPRTRSRAKAGSEE